MLSFPVFIVFNLDNFIKMLIFILFLTYSFILIFFIPTNYFNKLFCFKIGKLSFIANSSTNLIKLYLNKLLLVKWLNNLKVFKLVNFIQMLYLYGNQTNSNNRIVTLVRSLFNLTLILFFNLILLCSYFLITFLSPSVIILTFNSIFLFILLKLIILVICFCLCLILILYLFSLTFKYLFQFKMDKLRLENSSTIIVTCSRLNLDLNLQSNIDYFELLKYKNVLTSTVFSIKVNSRKFVLNLLICTYILIYVLLSWFPSI